MQTLFSRLALIDVRQDLQRNIVSIRHSQDLFDDLSSDPDDWALAQEVEAHAKPRPYASPLPILHRPFEDAVWANAIAWPFTNWRASRFSDGSFGVWYGADSIETTVYESSYHWYHGLLADAGFQNENVIGERKVYAVRCEAALLDFRRLARSHPDLFHKTDYSYARTAGARIHREGHPGLVAPSVRYAKGETYAIFNAAVLSNPRFSCSLTYRLEHGKLWVEQTPGTTWLEITLTH